jgi:hypothetical protein
MKTLAALAVILSVSSIANADILRPRNNFTATAYEGEAAQALWDSLKVKEQAEFATRVGSSKAKVLRAADGIFELVCVKLTTNNDEVSYNCEMKHSDDGRPVPQYRVRRRLG